MMAPKTRTVTMALRGALLFLASVIVFATVFVGEVSLAKSSQRCEQLFETSVSVATDISSRNLLNFSSRSDLVVKAMDVSLISNRTASVKMFPAFRYALEKLEQAMARLPRDLGAEKTVIYPMAGFDVTTPVRLFPKAATYILIDNNSLMKPAEMTKRARTRFEPALEDGNASYVHYTKVGEDLFSKLLTSLFAAVPEAKITSLELISDRQRNVNAKIVYRPKPRATPVTLYYFVGEFGKAEARIRGGRAAPTATAWWLELIPVFRPRAILVKGSMNALRPTAHDNVIGDRELLIRAVLEDGGIIVEGASSMPAREDAAWVHKNQSLEPTRERWELTDGDPRFSNPIAEADVREIKFSYNYRARVGVYAPQSER